MPRIDTMNSRLSPILVVGATGALGRPVVQALRKRGLPVRAVCRHPEQAADLAALGAEVLAADLADPLSITRAVAGTSRVLACAHSLLGRGRWRSEAVDDAGHRHLIAAAGAAGVRRFVYTSAYGVGPNHPVDFFRTKHGIEQVLLASGLDAVILRPTSFMEQHVHQFNGQGLLDKGKARLIGPGTKPRNFVAAADVAQLAVRALLLDPPPFRRLQIGSQGHYSNADVSALYARYAGVPLKVSHLPSALARLIAAVARPLHPGLARLLQLSSLPDDAFDEHFDGAAALESSQGLKLTTVEGFVQAKVAQARGQPTSGGPG